MDLNLADKIREKLAEIQSDVEQGFEERRQKFNYKLEREKVVFEKEVAQRHRLLKMKLSSFLRTSPLMMFVTAPVIYSVAIPIAMLDLFVTVYQTICFPVYGIPKVKRSEYVVMDRKYLAYLNVIQKINCIYCEYGNGVIAYAREVASRTEWFWCPIKHAKKAKGLHEHYYDFIDYGDDENFQQKWDDLRGKCRACEACGGDSCATTPKSPKDPA